MPDKSRQGSHPSGDGIPRATIGRSREMSASPTSVPKGRRVSRHENSDPEGKAPFYSEPVGSLEVDDKGRKEVDWDEGGEEMDLAREEEEDENSDNEFASDQPSDTNAETVELQGSSDSSDSSERDSFTQDPGAPNLPDDVLWWPSHVGIDIESLRKDARSLTERSIDYKLNHDLCKFCRVFFDSWCELTKLAKTDVHGSTNAYSAYYETIYQIESSSVQGCRLCAVLVSTLRSQERQNLHCDPSDPLCLDYLKADGLLLLCYDENVSRLMTFFTEIGDNKKSIVICISLVPQSLTNILGERPEPSSPTSSPIECNKVAQSNDCIEASMLLPRRWLTECRTKHETCNLSLDPKGQHVKPPTRLIKIDEEVPRLCLSFQQERCSEYATLSHCWGGLEFLKLMTYNISHLMTKIPSEDLSKTFRDAIEIARRLGFSWLWIDSLCIIQDDPQDWYRESGRMAGVYGQSSLNLMASAAPDGRTGCLFRRDSLCSRRGTVEVEISGERRKLDYADTNLFNKNVSWSPLLKRSWVLQERLLALRNLYFGLSDIVWECRSGCASEAFAEQLPAAMLNDASYLPTNEIWKSWRQIVQLYTAGNLTYQSDNMVAIAGIARKIYEHTGDEYFAGLWKSGMLAEVCWFLAQTRLTRNMTSTSSIPSWSWVAKMGAGAICYIKEQVLIPCAEIIEVQVTGSDRYVDVQGGVLTMKSKLPAFCTIKEFDSPLPRLKTVSIGSHSIQELKFWDFEAAERHYHLMFPIAIFKSVDGKRLCLKGLLLRRTGIANGQYQRLGMFKIQEELEVRNAEFLQSLFEGQLEAERKAPWGSRKSPTEADYVSVEVDDEGTKWYTITII